MYESVKFDDVSNDVKRKGSYCIWSLTASVNLKNALFKKNNPLSPRHMLCTGKCKQEQKKENKIERGRQGEEQSRNEEANNKEKSLSGLIVQ